MLNIVKVLLKIKTVIVECGKHVFSFVLCYTISKSKTNHIHVIKSYTVIWVLDVLCVVHIFSLNSYIGC